MTRTLFCSVAIPITMLSQAGAAPFINLDFEMANTNTLSLRPNNPFPYPFGSGPLQDLLPGWNLAFGSAQNNPLNYNGSFIGLGVATLVSREAYEKSLTWQSLFGSRFEGSYAMAFSLDSSRAFTLTQHGQVPTDARFLNYDGSLNVTLPVEARINGTLIPGGGDISSFAGQNVELEFRIYQKQTPFGPPFVGFNGAAFVVPEPGTLSLFGLGSILSYWLLNRRR